MNQNLVDELNKLNQKFYSNIGEEFDDSRSDIWPGMIKVCDLAIERFGKDSVKILDIGCGNARFVEPLLERFELVEYTGIDFSDILLKKAHERLSKTSINFTLKNFDILNDDWDVFAGKFDLVFNGGVIHHIPGFENRSKFLVNIKNCLNENGIAAIACWQFAKFERFQKKSLTSQEIDQIPGINSKEFEKDDYILDWQRGERALRYCHFVSEQEFKNLTEDLNINILQSFVSDGKTGNINQYFVIEKFA